MVVQLVFIALLTGACGRVEFESTIDGGANDGGGGFVGSNQSFVEASNPDGGDVFGYALALSADGSTLVVTSNNEDSSAQGIDGDQADNTASGAGAAYVFVRSGSSWVQQAYVKASNTHPGDVFGVSAALSGDGNTLAVGAFLEPGGSTGVNGNQQDTSLPYSGAVYVYTRSGSTWTQQAYVKASNTGVTDQFGDSIALSADGNTLAVAAYTEDSSATGIDGNQADDSAFDSGAVYVFTRAGTDWSQQAYIKASNTNTGDGFGGVTLSADGNVLAVSAGTEKSAATGVDGDQMDNSVTDAGAVYVFERAGTTWLQKAYVKASNTDAGDRFGTEATSLALSGDGLTLAVGATFEDSAAVGVGGAQADESASDAGAVYVFHRGPTGWAQESYVKASNTDADDQFGHAVSLSGDGSTLAVGARGEASAASGLDGDQADDSLSGAGAAYVFKRGSGGWTQRHYVKPSNPAGGSHFAHIVALSANATTLVVGAPDVSTTAASAGGVYIFE